MQNKDAYDKIDNKTRLLLILQILMEESDEKHPLNRAEIADFIAERAEAKVNEKTISSDINALKTAGYDIIKNKDGWFIAEQAFNLTELKILVDAVQAAKFIPIDLSGDIIEKLGDLCSRHNRKDLERDVYLVDRVKSENPQIFYYTDSIHEAIRERKKVSFKYCSWSIDNLEKKLVPKHAGKTYVATPLALVWHEENYYFIARVDGDSYDKTFRVDKLEDVKIVNEQAVKIDASDYCKGVFSKKAFGMFAGPTRKVTFEGKKSLAGVMIDRFGTDLLIFENKKGYFTCDVEIVISKQFYGWLTGLGEDVWITNPPEVVEGYKAHLQKLQQIYE